MKRSIPIHPPLVALYPVLSLYATNFSLIPIRDVMVSGAILVAAVLAAWFLLGFVLRSASRSAAAVSLFTFLFFAYGPTKSVVFPSADFNSEWFVWSWLAGSIALATTAAWKWRRPVPLTAYLNVAAVSLFALTIASVATSAVRVHSQVSRAALSVDSNGRPLDLQAAPDVYYIVLDGYGSADALREAIGFSNDAFLRALERRGFFVADRSRSNYCQTELSLASSLNLEYVHDYADKGTPGLEGRVILDARINRSEVAERFRKKGYRIVGVTSGFPPLTFDGADVVYTKGTDLALFRNALLARTPLPAPPESFVKLRDRRRNAVLSAFGVLKQLAHGGPAPRLVLAHILAPHPPFAFGANGEPVNQKMPFGLWDGSHYMGVGGTPETYREGYRNQIRYINKLVLETVDAILDQPGPKPVIVLQGDHGSKVGLDQGSLQKTDVRECFGILTAVHAPESVRQRLAEDVTPVNLFRHVLGGLFGDALPSLPERSYYSTWEKPFELVDVTESLTATQ